MATAGAGTGLKAMAEGAITAAGVQRPDEPTLTADMREAIRQHAVVTREVHGPAAVVRMSSLRARAHPIQRQSIGATVVVELDLAAVLHDLLGAVAEHTLAAKRALVAASTGSRTTSNVWLRNSAAKRRRSGGAKQLRRFFVLVSNPM